MSKRIAELTEGETFTECRFQVHSVRIQNAATGPCLVLKLGDETGTRWARRWKATDAEQKHALASKSLFVAGRVRTDGCFAGELEITALECLPRAESFVPAVPESVFQTLSHEAELTRQLQRVERAARVLFGAEDSSFQRQEWFEAEMRRALERAYTLGKNAPGSLLPTVPSPYPSASRPTKTTKWTILSATTRLCASPLFSTNKNTRRF